MILQVLVKEKDSYMIVENPQSSNHYPLELLFWGLDLTKNVMELGNWAMLVDKLLPIIEVEVGQYQALLLLLEKILIEFSIYLHVTSVTVLLIELE